MFEEIVKETIRRLRDELVPEILGAMLGELHGNTTKQNATLLYLALEARGKGDDDESSESRIRRAVQIAIEIDDAVDERLDVD